MRRINSRSVAIATCLALSVGLLAPFFSTTAVAQSRRGLPGRREPAGTRGGPGSGVEDFPECIYVTSDANNTKQKNLTVLVPASSKGQTIAEYPTFFGYLPKNKAESVEITLTDAAGKEIYRTKFRPSGEAGVISVAVPATAGIAPLALGQTYRWEIAMNCGGIDDTFLSAEGQVTRVVPPPALMTDLSKAKAQDRPGIYAKYQIWNEILISLAELRRANPTDAKLAADWASLMQSVNLPDLAQEPLLPITPQASRPTTTSQR